jgi:hypothetical protein
MLNLRPNNWLNPKETTGPILPDDVSQLYKQMHGVIVFRLNTELVDGLSPFFYTGLYQNIFVVLHVKSKTEMLR